MLFDADTMLYLPQITIFKGDPMNINPVKNSAGHTITPGISHGQVKSSDKTDKAREAKGNDVQVKMTFDHNQKLMVGAKTLLASLNKQLTIDKSFSFESFSKNSVNIKNGQHVALDKIEIKPFEFDFEEVAKNVMDFVSNVILGAKAGGASDEKLSELLSQARSGIDLGFSQAREQLKGSDIYTQDVEQGINKSYDLIQDSLSDLEQHLFAPVEQEPMLANQKISMLEQEQATISITTRDGDNINISFGSVTSLSQQQQFTNGEVSQQIDYQQTESFSFKVEGQLDQEELKAVTSLIKDIDKLASTFFKGDVEKAWQQAGKLGFDDQQIAQFAFDFKEVKQVAVLEHYSNGASDSPIATIAPYLKDLNSVVKQADSLFKGDNLKQLMHDVADQQVKLTDGLQGSSSQDFSEFNQQLLDA